MNIFGFSRPRTQSQFKTAEIPSQEKGEKSTVIFGSQQTKVGSTPHL